MYLLPVFSDPIVPIKHLIFELSPSVIPRKTLLSSSSLSRALSSEFERWKESEHFNNLTLSIYRVEN